jgi:hypothetical protein
VARDPHIGLVDLPPLDLLLYARSRPDARERFVLLTAVRMAYPALHEDPDWTRLLQDLRDEIGLTDAEHAAITRRAEGVAKALRDAFAGGPPRDPECG